MTNETDANASANHILIVDDDQDIRTLVAETLAERGFRTSTAANTSEMDQVLARDAVELILLDIMMPGEDGIEACRRIAARGGPPIVLLSALSDELDRVLGLELGASHYLAKPCSTREIVATVRAALRHRMPVAVETERRRFRFAGWRMNPLAHELLDPNGVLVELTDGEFTVLRTFVERPRRVLSREQLLEWTRGPDSDSFDRAVDVQISRLRRKLRRSGDDIIRTIRNEGYMFVPAVSWQ